MLHVELPKIKKLEPTGNPLDKDNTWKTYLLMEKILLEKPTLWIHLWILLGIS